MMGIDMLDDLIVTIYQMVTDRIIEQLEKGVVPWQRPWKNGTPSTE